MAQKAKTTLPIPVEATTHHDTRVNNPPIEMIGFMEEEEQKPKMMRYPRNVDLDPQLVWRGKDEQDNSDLAVPIVPIYLQEKIEPRAIIEDLRRSRLPDTAQPSLFEAFADLPFDQAVEFYQHEQDWTNRFILGDALTVMTSLAEKEGLKGKVQCIYLDPPYGIKFGSNWQVSTRRRDVKDGRAEDFTRQPEQIRAFRDTWKDGVHSYLAYLRDRLVSGRDLLAESGSVFVQIGDENMHRVRCLMDEIMGADNFVSVITFQKTSYQETHYLANVCDYVLWYAKDKENVKIRSLYYNKVEGDSLRLYRYQQDESGQVCGISRDEIESAPSDCDGWKRFKMSDITSPGWSEVGSQPVPFRSKTYRLNGNLHWKTNSDGMRRLILNNRLTVSGNSLAFVKYLDDFAYSPITNVWTDTLTGSFAEPRVYVVQTNTRVIQRCILMTTDTGDLVLDPTCGSGTTAYVAEQWGRRWITIDTSRVALSLARTRLMTARYLYYLLADSSEGVQKEAEITGITPPSYTTTRDVRRGFVFRRVPHITLKSISTNPEIDAIYERWQRQMEPALDELNRLMIQQWEEWEVPRDAGDSWPGEALRLLDKWWQMRLDRQAEFDASIARRAETELLYDQPYEDPKRVRVSGPFTVESLSPFRVLSTEEEQPESERTAQFEDTAVQFEALILDNLRKAGVQNTVAGERLKFDSLEPYAGEPLHAAGTFTENDTVKRVAVCIGPEHGTVGPELVREAAIAARKGEGFDVLVLLGFAFDPHVGEEAKRYGKLTVLPTRMNADLAMGDLLKKTGSGNLFTVFGEPDLDVQNRPDGTMTVEVRGVDVYDPTTGQIRSNSTADIACWFIDTRYNEESFFVRHAYFTGADEPYDKLKRAMKSDIDPDAWASLYRTISRPFPVPDTKKIAVKVINHYGDEVLKVYPV